MEFLVEITNIIVETGAAEMILTAAGLPVVAAGVAIYRKTKKTGQDVNPESTTSLLSKLWPKR
jgi:hypothetical protein